MKPEIQQKIQSISEVDLPDGTYEGIMGGYDVQYNLPIIRRRYWFKTNIGIKAIGVPVWIDVHNKIATVKPQSGKF